MAAGGDWTLIDRNGTARIDVRQTFETDDGAFIQVYETGNSVPDGLAHVRLSFETGSPKYDWVNTIVGVGILRILDDNHISIDAWQACIHQRAVKLISAHTDLLALAYVARACSAFVIFMNQGSRRGPQGGNEAGRRQEPLTP